MKTSLVCVIVSMLLTAAAAAVPAAPESWSAVDGLGRRLDAVPSRKSPERPRLVAIFYWLWHYAHAQIPPRNITRIIAAHPEARNDFKHPIWENTPPGTSYFWNEPLFGYYTNLDPYVIRKHAELLADAGIDVIVFDCTNGTFTWMPAVEALIRGFQAARRDGVRTPQFAFMLNFAPNANTAAELKQLYRDLYRRGVGEELWFLWEGKPLIMAHSDALDPKSPDDREILDFFTFRRNEPSYFAADTPAQAQTWGWSSVWPQTRYGVGTDGKVEQMTVSVAQNASRHGLVAMNDSRGGVFGRGDAKEPYMLQTSIRGGALAVKPGSSEAVEFGLNFQQQWDRALEIDPDLIFVTGWNEWIVGRHSTWIETENAFPDQYIDEFSRDIEPSAGRLKDHFYYQLTDNVRRYKGSCGPPQVMGANRTIELADPVEAWDPVLPVYVDYRNDTPSRDAAGWQGTHYRTPALRNDLVRAQVAWDDRFVTFLIETAGPLSPPGENWMRLLIDTDPVDAGPNWEGFEFIVNRQPPVDGKAMLERFIGPWRCGPAIPVDYATRENRLLVKIPRAALGFGTGGAIPRFEFKWADDNCADGDILDVYRRGDAAPGGRFRYVFAP